MSDQTFVLCHGCACEVTSGDESARDFYNLSDEDRYARDANIEAMGVVAQVATEDLGCFTCFVCDEHAYGEGHIFERV